MAFKVTRYDVLVVAKHTQIYASKTSSPNLGLDVSGASKLLP